MSSNRKIDAAVALDVVVAIAALAFGIYLVASGWPEPGFWAWVFLAGGILGLPLAFLNPMAKVRKWIFRKMVKR